MDCPLLMGGASEHKGSFGEVMRTFPLTSALINKITTAHKISVKYVLGTRLTVEEYIESARDYYSFLHMKKIPFSQKRFCKNCKAFFIFSDIVSKKMAKPRIMELGLCGECELGFPQKWTGRHEAIPLLPCPKPQSIKRLILCFGGD
jgi:RNase P subunit RPR2